MRKGNPSLPLSEWPETDRLAWQAAIRKPRFLEKSGLAAGWSQPTRATNIHSYGRWLAFLSKSMPEALDLDFPARCTEENVEAYTRQLAATTAPLSVMSSIQGLTRMLQVMGPAANWSWLEMIRNDLKLDARPIRDKRKKLTPSDEILVAVIKALRRLQELPTSRATLTEYRNLLMVAILTPCPIRRKNFADLTISTNFVRTDTGWKIFLAAETVKNGEPASLEVPTLLTEYIDYYIDNVRAVFPNSVATGKLWLNWYGKPMSGHSVYLRMIEVTEKHLGKALNPHIFRDCAATFLSWESPGAVRSAQGLLGHRTPRTTNKHYIHARQIESGRLINALLQQLTDKPK